MCFVSRKKEEPIKGFQRLLNKKRAEDIANYLDVELAVILVILIDENNGFFILRCVKLYLTIFRGGQPWLMKK